jgi:hypothetical protein
MRVKLTRKNEKFPLLFFLIKLFLLGKEKVWSAETHALRFFTRVGFENGKTRLFFPFSRSPLIKGVRGLFAFGLVKLLCNWVYRVLIS